MARPHASHTVALLVATVAGFVFGVLGTEATFGKLRKPVEAPLLYAVELRNQAGALLASPLLVGEQGAGVHLDLSQLAPGNDALAQEAGAPPLQMSLDLSPEASHEPGADLCVGYRLSIDDGAAHKGALHAGRISLALGEPRSVELSEGGERLKLEVTVARAGSKAYDWLLRKRRTRPVT